MNDPILPLSVAADPAARIVPPGLRDAHVGGLTTDLTFPTRVSRAYESADLTQRARLLELMLPAVRPMALTVLGAGVLSRYLFRTNWTDVSIDPGDAARVDARQVMGIARYVEQSSPERVLRITEALDGPSPA
jgi:hypothetical protein